MLPFVRQKPFESFKSNCSVYEMISAETLSSDAYVVLCATLATVAFIINLGQMIVMLFMSRCWKSMYLVSSCAYGMTAAFGLIYYALVETELVKAGQKPTCGMASSLITMIIILGYTGNLTCVTVHRWLAFRLPNILKSVKRNAVLCFILSAFGTAQVVIFCFLGSDSFYRNSATKICLPPYEWGSQLASGVYVTYTTEMLVVGMLLVSLTMGSQLSKSPSISALDVQILWMKYVLLLICTLPFIGLTVYHATMLDEQLCFIVKDAIQVWTLVATVILATVVSAIHLFSDAVLCRGTLHLLERCCCMPNIGPAVEGQAIKNTDNSGKNQFILMTGNRSESRSVQQTDVIY